MGALQVEPGDADCFLQVVHVLDSKYGVSFSPLIKCTTVQYSNSGSKCGFFVWQLDLQGCYTFI
jgi:hypothetical protein